MQIQGLFLNLFKNCALHIWQYFDITERKQRDIIFAISNIRAKKAIFLTKTINDYGQILKFQFSTVKSALLSLTIL